MAEVSRGAIRKKMKHPLLMLHILSLVRRGNGKDGDDTNTDEEGQRSFPAIGFSFPKYPDGTGPSSGRQPISVKANSVWIQQMKDESDLEEEADD